MKRFAPVATAAALLGAAPGSEARVQIGPERVVVEGKRARAIVTRAPFGLRFEDGRGRLALRQVEPDPTGVLPLPAHTQSQFGTISPPPPAMYSPLAFLVGEHQIAQETAQQWEGNLISVTRAGVEYAARDVTAAVRAGSGARLTVSTTDPSGRSLVVGVRPGPRGTIAVSARPDPPDGVAAMSDSFAAAPTEAFRGFGGRHDSLDQRGSEFYNWLQQENLSSGSFETVTEPSQGETYMFPNGEHAAYYVQSSFVSPGRYGFLLDRDELSHWRIAYDRPDAWRVEAAAPAIDYLVAPGGAKRAIATLTRINGRQPLPPDWALGSLMDRLVKFPEDPPESHLANVESDLREIARHRVPVDGYRIEGWQFLPRHELRRLIAALRARGIHPMLYFRLFVGQDEIGTDDPRAYDEALEKGYVATTADGRPYTFVSNFSEPGAQIDFTNPAAVAWWKGRIREALELGADGFMQDFGEQVLHDMHFHDGNTGEVLHNRLAGLAHRATREVVEQFEREHPDREIFFYTRAGHSGTPGAAAFENANFPGDETTDWTRSAGLASLATDMLNRAIGGAWGFTTDIGGFFDVGPYQPTSRELFLRWAEWAALSPFFRLHGSVAAGTHMPWTYDREAVSTYNALAQLHRRARPLIRRLWRRAMRTGIPMTRPLWLAFPRDERAAEQDQEWLLGPHVLVAPVVAEGASERAVYFPRGCWRSPESGRRYRGPRSATVPARVQDLPYFFRCRRRPFRPFAGAAARLPARRACGRRRLPYRLIRSRRRGRIVSTDVYVNGVRATVQDLPLANGFAFAVVTRTDRGHAARSARTYPRCR
jgi:alpha-glucosidase